MASILFRTPDSYFIILVYRLLFKKEKLAFESGGEERGRDGVYDEPGRKRNHKSPDDAYKYSVPCFNFTRVALGGHVQKSCPREQNHGERYRNINDEKIDDSLN